MHPTKLSLIETTCELLESRRADEIQVDEVLTASGVSKGSLYHHFEDFGDLLETAMVKRYVLGAERDIASLKSIFESTTDKESLLNTLELVTENSQSDANRNRRFDRAEVLARSQGNARLHSRLAFEQQRVNAEFATLIEFGQRKGWFREDISASAAAVFIQAYTLGRLVDDVTDSRIDAKEWNTLINHVLRRALAN